MMTCQGRCYSWLLLPHFLDSKPLEVKDAETFPQIVKKIAGEERG